MGAVNAPAMRWIDAEIELRREAKEFAHWTLQDVQQLYGRFRKTFGLAVTASQFDDLLLLKAPEAVASKEVFDALDTNRDGRIDGLELLAALVCVCRATFEEKAQFAFELFDFNDNGSLSTTELALLMKSVWIGMGLLTDQSAFPSNNSASRSSSSPIDVMMACLELAEAAFRRYDKDGSDTLGYDEFVAWARSNRSFMLQVEQFRLVAEKATGFEEELSLPDGSDEDSDLEDEIADAASVVPRVVSSDHSSPDLRSQMLAREDSEPSSGSVGNQTITTPPPVNLKLDWVYGTNGPRSRNNCHFLSSGETVYSVANYAVIHSSVRHEQRYYRRHKRFIQCLAVNESGEIVATADGNGTASSHNTSDVGAEIHVWHGNTLQCLAVLRNFHEQGVSLVAFPAPKSAATSAIHNAHAQPIGSSGSTSLHSSHLSKKTHRHTEMLLASVGSDANASMALWNWREETVIASGRALGTGASSLTKSRRRALAMALSEDGDEIVVCGTHFVVFHEVDGRFFKQKQPQLLPGSEQERRSSMLIHAVPVCLSVAYYGIQDVVIGTARGELLRFQRRKLTQVVQAHEPRQSVTTTMLSYRSMVLFTSGKDGRIKQWDSTLKPIGSPIDLHTFFAAAAGKIASPRDRGAAIVLQNEDFRVSSLAYDPRRHRFLVATRQGNIIEFTDEASTEAKNAYERDSHVVASGHTSCQVSGTATGNLGTCFASYSAAAKCVKIWCLRRRFCIAQLRLTTFSPVKLAFSNACDLLLVGGHDGSLMLCSIRNMTLTPLTTMKNTSAVPTTIRFAPDDQTIGVGRANGLIYIYRVEDTVSGGEEQRKALRLTRYALLKPMHYGEDETATVLEISSFDFSVDGNLLRSELSNGHTSYWDLRQRACVRLPGSAPVIQTAQWLSHSRSVEQSEANHPRRSGLDGGSCHLVSSYSKKLALLTCSESGDIGVASFPGQPYTSKNLAKMVQCAHLVTEHAYDWSGSADTDSSPICTGDFALRDSYAITTSRGSAAICQWRVEEEVQDAQPHPPCQSDRMFAKLESLGLDDVYFPTSTTIESDRHGPETFTLAGFSAQTKVLTDSPTPATCTEAPDLDLSLSDVFGMNCRQTSINRMIASTATQLVYSVGTLLVSRRHQGGRTSQHSITRSGLRHAISCVVHHPSLPVIAVGSRHDGRVVLFSPTDDNSGFCEVATISGDASTTGRTLITVRFLDSGALARSASATPAESAHLIAVVWKDDCNVHSLAFYDWKKQQASLVASAQMTQAPVLFGEFVSVCALHSQEGRNKASFVSGGVNHVTFWELNTATAIVSSQQGVFGHHAIVQTMICAASVENFVVTGGEDGSLVVWSDGVAAHTYRPPNSASTLGEAAKSVGSVTKGLIALTYIPSRRQVIGATQNGGVTSWQCGADLQNVKPSALLQVVRTVSVSSLQRQIQEPKNNQRAIGEVGARSETAKNLVGFQLIEESNDALAVLASGEVLRLELDLSVSNSLTGSADSLNEDGRPLATDASVLVDSMSDTEDVALHPREPWLALCSSSGVVSVWDLATKQVKQSLQYARKAHAVCWGGLGTRLAVSLSDGSVHILNGTSLDEEADVLTCGEARSNHHATLLKYASSSSENVNGCLLAAACTDFNIYIYASLQEVVGSNGAEEKLSHSLIHTFVGHTSPIVAFDFSIDSKWLQSASSCRHRQVLRWPLQPDENAASKSNSAPAGVIECTLSDDQWVTWTLPLSGPAAGLDELCGTGVSAVCRIQGEGADTNWHSRLPTMAIGTDSGDVLLAWYPVTAGNAAKSMPKEYRGFLSACTSISRVEFSFGNSFLVALGQRYDGHASVLVWRTDYEDEIRQLQRMLGTLDDPIGKTATSTNVSSSASSTDERYRASDHLTNLFVYGESDTKGDEFLAVRSWAGAIREPSDYVESKQNANSPPEQELQLEFVYGINVCATASNCAFYADDTWEIVYTSASIGIVYNTKTQTQLLHQGHDSNAISALAVHPRGDLVVTGECGVNSKSSPRIILWDANSGSNMAQVATVHTGGVLLLSFAPSGDKFASIGMEGDHILAIYAIVNGRFSTGARSNSGNQEGGGLQVQLLSSVKTSKQRVLGLCVNDEGEAVTCGEQHLLFYQHSTSSFQRGSNASTAAAASVKRALFSSHKECNSRATVLQAAHLFKPQMVVSSQSDGSLYLWKDRKCVEVKLAAHGNAPIPALSVDRKQQLIFSGGHDGKICIWNAQLDSLHVIDLVQLAASSPPSQPLTSTRIQSLAVRDGRVLVVTAGSELCELFKEDDTAGRGQSAHRGTGAASYRLVIHQRGHTTGELWGLDTHPTKLQFATAGDDGTVRLWDSPTRSLLALYQWEGVVKASRKQQPQHQLRALAFSTDGSHLAVGASDGVVRVLSSSCDAVITEWKSGGYGVRSLKYSPDGSVLAVGSQDRRVHLLDAKTYCKLGELRGHTSAVSHMDFSKDGNVLQTVSVGAGELLFWDVKATKQIASASAVRDTQWETWSCPFGWPVQGIYPPESDGSDVNAVSRSRDRRVLATGGDDCCVRLFRHPCVPRGQSASSAATARVYVGHASHVTSCKFSASDAFVLSTGGRDQTICQFRYVPSSA